MMLIDDLNAFARDPKGYPDGAVAILCSNAADSLKAAYAELAKLRSERDALQHDIERYIEIATSLVAGRDAAARDMRERCAKVADDMKPAGESEDYTSGVCDASLFIAEAIRALPDTPTVMATEGKTNG